MLTRQPCAARDVLLICTNLAVWGGAHMNLTCSLQLYSCICGSGLFELWKMKTFQARGGGCEWPYAQVSFGNGDRSLLKHTRCIMRNGWCNHNYSSPRLLLQMSSPLLTAGGARGKLHQSKRVSQTSSKSLSLHPHLLFLPALQLPPHLPR